MLTLQVNGQTAHIEVRGETALLHVLRNDLALNGPKYGCGLGECGACSVLVDGQLVRSCVMPVAAAIDRQVVTLEGLGTRDHLHPVQRAFIEAQAAQCGYCTNGMIMATVALLRVKPQPTEMEIRDSLSHHLCRCGTHMEILAAVRRAAVLMAEVPA